MLTTNQVREIALGFEEAVELPHFERASFRIRKKIFATMDEKAGIAVLMFTPVEQAVFTGFDKAAIYPVSGGWGAKGATVFELDKIKRDLFEDALSVAYCLKAPRALAAKYEKL
jgi:hypothetical protein